MQKLSANLFRQNVKIDGDFIGNNAIHIYEAENPYEESAFLIWRINSLVRKSGMRYRGYRRNYRRYDVIRTAS